MRSMKQAIIEFPKSFVAGITAVAMLVAIASVPGLASVGALLAPGLFLAGGPFPEGVHSDHPLLYLTTAGLINSLIYGWPALWMARAVARIAGSKIWRG